jgi:hypothetical protein
MEAAIIKIENAKPCRSGNSILHQTPSHRDEVGMAGRVHRGLNPDCCCVG